MKESDIIISGKKVEYDKRWVKGYCVNCGLDIKGDIYKNYEERGNYCTTCNSKMDDSTNFAPIEPFEFFSRDTEDNYENHNIY